MDADAVPPPRFRSILWDRKISIQVDKLSRLGTISGISNWLQKRQTRKTRQTLTTSKVVGRWLAAGIEAQTGSDGRGCGVCVSCDFAEESSRYEHVGGAGRATSHIRAPVFAKLVEAVEELSREGKRVCASLSFLPFFLHEYNTIKTIYVFIMMFFSLRFKSIQSSDMQSNLSRVGVRVGETRVW